MLKEVGFSRLRVKFFVFPSRIHISLVRIPNALREKKIVYYIGEGSLTEWQKQTFF